MSRYLQYSLFRKQLRGSNIAQRLQALIHPFQRKCENICELKRFGTFPRKRGGSEERGMSPGAISNKGKSPQVSDDAPEFDREFPSVEVKSFSSLSPTNLLRKLSFLISTLALMLGHSSPISNNSKGSHSH